MRSSDPDRGLTARIVEVLEEHGIGRHDYRLYDAVDPEALERVVTSGGGDVEVAITIQGIRVTVNGDRSIEID